VFQLGHYRQASTEEGEVVTIEAIKFTPNGFQPVVEVRITPDSMKTLLPALEKVIELADSAVQTLPSDDSSIDCVKALLAELKSAKF
jgi:hypothetical protein